MHVDQESQLAVWEASSRSAAQADVNAILTAHLRKFDLQVDPELLLAGTIDFVRAAVTFSTVDGRPVAGFLDSQTYDLSTTNDVPYTVTFDVFGRAFARLNSDAHLRALDLADLYGMPWHRYELVGYERFWVSRIDGADLSPAELDGLEQDVREDLLFDYGEDELEIWFDRDDCRGALLVSVRDREESSE